jgi:(2S)-methylsuccinyl-CoA dehydrogenase
MSFLTDEHEAVRQTVRKFTEEKVMPIADEYYRGAQEIPMDLIKQMANLGFFGMSFPEEWGGAGMDAVSMTRVTEELSRGWLGVGSVLTRNLITGTLILAHGTQEQKEKYLPGIVSGDILTAAAFTEPNAGSDTAGMQLRAVRDGDE